MRSSYGRVSRALQDNGIVMSSPLVSKRHPTASVHVVPGLYLRKHDADVDGTREDTGTETTDSLRGDLSNVDGSHNSRLADAL